MISSN